jgi:dihydroflavonol-4-reductase
VDFLAGARRRVWDINVLGSANLYDAVLSLGISKLVDTSSITALGPSPYGRLMDEASGNPYQKLNPIMFADAKEALAAVDSSLRGDYGFLTKSRLMYFDSKLAATELSRRYAQHRGLPVIRIFPGTAVGPGDLHYSISQLVDSVWQGRLGLTYSGGTAFMDSRDFARGVVLALDKGKIGDEYILAGKPEDNLTYVDFMALIAATARSSGSLDAMKRPPLVLPAYVARPASRMLEKLAPGLGVSYGMSLSACIQHRFSSAKAMRELGYAPDTALADSIKDCREFSSRYGNGER